MSTTVVASRRTLPYKLTPVSEVMEHAKFRAENRVTMSIPKVADLKLRWEDQGPSHSKAGYFAKIDGRDMRLSDSAMTTACRIIKSTPKFFNQFPDKNAFPTTMRHILDHNGVRNGVQLRHDGLEVNAILPREYKIRDAHQMLSEFMEALDTSLGNIQGILPQEKNWGESLAYRIVLGSNLVPAVNEKHGQLIMFNLAMSEVGLHPMETMLGLFRSICTNSAVRSTSKAQWDHHSSVETFLNNSHETIRNMGYMSSQFSKVFSELLNMRLEHNAVDMVNAMLQSGSISRNHAEIAELYANMPTEDGRAVETQYDLFNVMTRAAQDLPSMKAQESAEASAMTLFTSPGGIYAALQQAAARRQKPVDIFDAVAN